MLARKVILKNWRNFRNLEVALRDRAFVIGPNASGKSNLLDVFRFLREIAKPSGGGLQKAVQDRGGISKLRCLAARQEPEVGVRIELAPNLDAPIEWVYDLCFRSEAKGLNRIMVSRERVQHNGTTLLNRPTKEDSADDERLTQTFIEQINANQAFRDIARFLESVTYLHMVPQLVRFGDKIAGKPLADDPFGQEFLQRIASTTERTRASRLRRIQEALVAAVPQMRELIFDRDEETGLPHLATRYEHWRPQGAWQREDQFSDGTLRLIGLLWSLLDGDGLLLLEEPELSLNDEIVKQLPLLMTRVQRGPRSKRQILISTHSQALLSDQSIDYREVITLQPDAEGTTVLRITEEDKVMLESGFSPGEVLLPKAKPAKLEQLVLFT